MNSIWSPENAGTMWVVTIVIALLACAFWILIQWRIFAKAGFPGALALINLGMFIPVIGPLVPIALQAWFAFTAWPALNKPPQP